MNYDELMNEIRGMIIGALKKCEPDIISLGRDAIGESPITGMAVEISPRHKGFSIHFRKQFDREEFSYPDWGFWNFFDGRNLFEGFLGRIESEYGNLKIMGDEYMLILNTALADALLCEEVVAFLQSLGVAKYYRLNALGGSPFVFVVKDFDECVDLNFCELIKWRRNFHRIQGSL